MSSFAKGLFDGMKHKPLNIQRECYTMASTDGVHADIQLYGEIVEEHPVDYWTGETLSGSYISLNEFLHDLEMLQHAKTITMRLNSVGGDAYASITIHNRLRELKGELTAIVDGVAMSGGSLIMCAADKVQVNASSLIMIHKCASFLYGYFNADELQKVIGSNESADKAQAAIYKRKTGLDENTILSMMGEETYMTGTEALEKGFADELLDTDAPQIAASADCRTLYVNGRAMHLNMPLANLPDTIPTVKTAEQAVEIHNKLPEHAGAKGGTTMVKNLDELRTEHPELAEQLMAEAQSALTAENENVSAAAAAAERERIKEIDEIACLYPAEMVQEAKYGEKLCTAQELSYRAALEARKNGSEFLDDLNTDGENSGAKSVKAIPGEDDGSLSGNSLLTPEQSLETARKDIAAIFGKKEG